MAFPIATPAGQIAQLYVGYFGRAPDPDGLNYWINQFDAGMSLQAIANSFAVQPEATALYAYLAAPAVGDPAAFVSTIYRDLFNRQAESAGLAYWVNQLVVQHMTPGQAVLNIISGAQGSDITAIQNKTHVAVDYAQKFVDNNLTWLQIDDSAGARAVVAPVTSDPATVIAATALTDSIILREQTNPLNIQLTLPDAAGAAIYSGTLLPGQFLFGGPGGNDKLILSNGNVADGVLVGFEKLELVPGTSDTLSVAQWNSFSTQISGPGMSTVVFADGLPPVSTAMTAVAAIESYDFSRLGNGVTMTTGEFAGTGPVMGPGSVLGTAAGDVFNVDELDLVHGLTIDGGPGIDTINVAGNLVLGPAFGTQGIAGTTNAQVTNVEVLNLPSGANAIGFNPGTAFSVVDGNAGVDRVVDPQTLVGAWVMHLEGGANVIQIDAAAADISAGTITSAGGTAALEINGAGATNTRMNVAEYTLFAAAGIRTTGGSTFANTTITFSNQVTGGAVLDASVGNWELASAGDTFTPGALAQNIRVGCGDPRHRGSLCRTMDGRLRQRHASLRRQCRHFRHQ